MKNKNVLYLTQAAMIAALYVVLTLIANALGLASQSIQLRFSEALTLLPYFTSAAIPGLLAGCIVSNVITGCMVPDIVFGSMATLIGALGTHALRKVAGGSFRRRLLLPLPPIAANTVIIPFVLRYGYGIPTPIWLNALTVGLGEVLSCGVLGLLLLSVMERRRVFTPSAYR